MTIITATINKKTYHTHTSWLSDKQKLLLRSVPLANNELKWAYTFAVLSLSWITSRNITSIGNIYRSLGFYKASGGIFLGSYLFFSWIESASTKREVSKAILRNDCGSTPFWEAQDKVINLSLVSGVRFGTLALNRRWGVETPQEDLALFKPDVIYK